MPDVLAMEQVLMHPSLVKCLSNLTIRTPAQQVSLWLQQKRLHHRSTALLKSLGRKGITITSKQAKHLDSLGLGLHKLVQIRDSHSKEGFQKCLKDKGVGSKALRNKLQTALDRMK